MGCFDMLDDLSGVGVVEHVWGWQRVRPKLAAFAYGCPL